MELDFSWKKKNNNNNDNNNNNNNNNVGKTHVESL